MDAPFLSPITKRYADYSTAKAFAFSFFCDACGKEWRSTPQAFAPGALESSVDIRIIRMLWNGQHKAAYEQANLEAIYAFSLCQTCGRRVCMACFYQSETDITDFCQKCLATGKKVVHHVRTRMAGS